LQHVGANLEADKAVVMAAIHADAAAFQFTCDTLKADKEFVLAAVSINVSAPQYPSTTMKSDKDVALVAIRVQTRPLRRMAMAANTPGEAREEPPTRSCILSDLAASRTSQDDVASALKKLQHQLSRTEASQERLLSDDGVVEQRLHAHTQSVMERHGSALLDTKRDIFSKHRSDFDASWDRFRCETDQRMDITTADVASVREQPGSAILALGKQHDSGLDAFRAQYAKLEADVQMLTAAMQAVSADLDVRQAKTAEASHMRPQATNEAATSKSLFQSRADTKCRLEDEIRERSVHARMSEFERREGHTETCPGERGAALGQDVREGLRRLQDALNATTQSIPQSSSRCISIQIAGDEHGSHHNSMC